MTKVVKDSFGVEINAGDYLVFAVKTRYLGALSMGRVIKVTPSGGLSLLAVTTYGMTVQEQSDANKKRYQELVDSGTDPERPWIKRLAEGVTPYKTTIQSGTTCYKVRPPVDVVQILGGSVE